MHPIFRISTAVGMVLLLAGPGAHAVDFESLADRARTLAAAPYRPAANQAPASLRQLNYDQMRDIRFRPERAVWRNEKLPFELMFFHLGGLQAEPIHLSEQTAGAERPLRYDPADFSFGTNATPKQPWGDLGYAGFRVHYPLNSPAYKDELVAFLGASYFRALGKGQHYGLSARGLAVDTVGNGAEEFPRFTDFWIERPKPGADVLTVFALLDSPRVAGAYRFDIRPGVATQMTVHARLFLRASAHNPIRTLGIAPLTSMFFFGENQPKRDDFRPEVHDSDGLMVATGEGEWLWRPLHTPRQILVTSFATQSPRGFGLMQRDRAFSSYEDSEAQYERRPSAWVTPLGDWGPGRVELVQLPTPDETQDNVVAYWVATQLPAAGQPLDLRWRIDWAGDAQQRPPLAWVAQTRAGRSYAPLATDERQFLIDFVGPALPATGGVQAVVHADGNGQIVKQNLYPVPATGAWRLALTVKTRDTKRPVELRAHLVDGSRTLSETWTYALTAP